MLIDGCFSDFDPLLVIVYLASSWLLVSRACFRQPLEALCHEAFVLSWSISICQSHFYRRLGALAECQQHER